MGSMLCSISSGSKKWVMRYLIYFGVWFAWALSLDFQLRFLSHWIYTEKRNRFENWSRSERTLIGRWANSWFNSIEPETMINRWYTCYQFCYYLDTILCVEFFRVTSMSWKSVVTILLDGVNVSECRNNEKRNLYIRVVLGLLKKAVAAVKREYVAYTNHTR